MTEGSLLIQAAIARSISNLDSARHRNVSLEKRKEGWTEVWGERDEVDRDEEDDDAEVASLLATPYPQLPITLVQFRPAWTEQLVLRVAEIPHIVVNSPYAATEATGSLPFLRDLQPAETDRNPVLIGRNQPTPEGPSPNNTILEYLVTARDINLDKNVVDNNQKALAHMYRSIINNELEPMLGSLRYHDKDAWEQVYRGQYLRAGASRFMVWALRVVGRKRTQHLPLEHAKAMARPAYASLDTVLKEKVYLLGSDKPTTVDAMLFGHIAEALGDVYLVTVLADFPNLVKYFQRIYVQYFRCKAKQEWMVWNDRQNMTNPFQQLPIERSPSTQHDEFKDALGLMQSLSVNQHDLQELLEVSKEKRHGEVQPRGMSAQSTWYRWRMGGNVYPKQATANEEDDKTRETPQQAKWRKDHKYNDELWISGVIAATGLALAFGIRNSK